MKSVVILGNYILKASKAVVDFIKNWEGEMWTFNCNYSETLPITKVCSIHPDAMIDAEKYRIENSKTYKIMLPAKHTDVIEKYGFESFKKYIGWSTGMELINEAYSQGYDEIIIAGFKFSNGFTIYHPDSVIISNFEKQFIQLTQKYDKSKMRSLDNVKVNEMLGRKEENLKDVEKVFKGKDYSDSTISVMASGMGINTLTKKQTEEVNNSYVFRCNWFFNDNLSGIKKDLDGYFFIVKDQNLLKGLKEANNYSIDTYFTPLTIEGYEPKVDYWKELKDKDSFYKQFLNPKDERSLISDVGLPTTGISMFAYATSLQPKKLIYAGMDFYKPDNKRKTKDFDYLGHKDSGVNPYLNEGSSHSLEADLKVFIKGVLQYKYPKKLIILGSKFVKKLKDFIVENRDLNFQELYSKAKNFYMEY